MRKKILFLSQMYPYPPDGGGKIKTLNTLLTLARQYTISAVFVSETKPTASELNKLERHGIKVRVFYSQQILASVKDDLVSLVWHFLHFTPHYVFQYTCLPAFPYVRQLIKEFQPDIIHVDHLNMAQYLPKEKRQVWILEHHNVETYLYWTRFWQSRKITRKAYLLIEMILTFLFEWRTLRLFDHIFTISEAESDRLKKIFKITNVSNQPLVYPVIRLKRTLATTPYILFIGNLGWPPNEDAVEWFLREILPKINKKWPNVEFHVVGKRAPRYEKNWPKPNSLYLHGYQKSLTPFLRQAHLFVLPFRMGGGLRLKALTALSAGLPVVTTPLGIEGLRVKDGQELLLASTADQFAQTILKLLASPRRQKTLGAQGQRLVKKYYSVKENQRFLRLYREIIQEFS